MNELSNQGKLENMMQELIQMNIGMNTEIGSINSKVESVEKRMDTLEYHTNISGSQRDMITTTAKRSVYRVLGDDEDLVARYYGSFIRKAYSDASRYAGMARRIIDTERGNYQRVIDYLDVWQPEGGKQKLMDEADRKAEAYKQAKKQGYKNI